MIIPMTLQNAFIFDSKTALKYILKTSCNEKNTAIQDATEKIKVSKSTEKYKYVSNIELLIRNNIFRIILVAAIILIPILGSLLVFWKITLSEPKREIVWTIANKDPANVSFPKFSGPIYLATNDVTKISPKIEIIFSDIIQSELEKSRPFNKENSFMVYNFVPT